MSHIHTISNKYTHLLIGNIVNGIILRVCLTGKNLNYRHGSAPNIELLNHHNYS